MLRRAFLELPADIMPRILPIILFISPHCLMSWLTSWTERPEPAAMRLRRWPLMTLGLARSSLVMEWMMASMRVSWESSRLAPGCCAMARSMPGIMLAIFCRPPILRICCIWASMSSIVKPSRSMRSASAACCSSATFWACSMMPTTSPMPRMRLAMRSGWKTSSESGFSPMETNLMGLPVTSRTESAPPPRASPSSLDIMTPSKSTRLANSVTTLTMSWPVMASTTMRIWSGLTACLMATASRIISSSICRRPAVSTMTMSFRWSTASWMAPDATLTASLPSPR